MDRKNNKRRINESVLDDAQNKLDKEIKRHIKMTKITDYVTKAAKEEGIIDTKMKNNLIRLAKFNDIIERKIAQVDKNISKARQQ